MNEHPSSPIHVEQMPPLQRIEALLAERQKPASRDWYLEYAEAEREDPGDVDAVLTQPEVERVEDPKLGPLYRIAPDHQEATFQRLGTTHNIVSSYILKRMLADLDDE